MSSARYVVGDVFDVLATLEPGSIDVVCSSPPFLALRSYLPAEHGLKAKEIGSEATPGEYIDVLLDVVEACARVLAPHGSLVFELGDTYAGSGGAGGDYNEGGLRDGAPRFDGSARKGREFRPPPVDGKVTDRKRTFRTQPRDGYSGGGKGWPLDKSKVLIPQLFAIALAYGFNPLTGRQTEPWRVRNTVAWCRPNPPVGRDGDKFRPATSFLTIACKARDRYWDGDAVRVPYAPGTLRQYAADADDPIGSQRATAGSMRRSEEPGWQPEQKLTHAGAPLLDWWEIPTQPYAGSHYATYPAALVVPIIKACCPQRVCRVCGEPSRRITEAVVERVVDEADAGKDRIQGRIGGPFVKSHMVTPAEYETVGWSDCGCCMVCGSNPPTGHDESPDTPSRWRTGVVLDPFAGSGTTLQVATGHGREAIGIDLDSRNAELAVERIGGLFLTVERFAFPIGEVS